MAKMKYAAIILLMLGFLASLFGQNKTPDDFPPKPKWRPDIPVDLSVITDRASYYTDKKQTVVIFCHGTCVVLASDAANPQEEAKAVLDRVYRYHPDFNPQEMDDGNFVVSYSQPNCISIVMKTEFEKHREYIRNHHLDGVVRDEVLLNAEKKPNVFNEHGMIGLFGRARMFMDAQHPEVARILRPQ
ncbi:hypothetical protein ACXR0O_24920 [Verrucomicrobiota bacterium sgz303538]